MLRLVQNSKLFQPLISSQVAFQKRTLASVSNDLENAYDVVIIGGGVAGVTLACSLGKVLRAKYIDIDHVLKYLF